jgi:hypothetical protein
MTAVVKLGHAKEQGAKAIPRVVALATRALDHA